tara:strand:+ start:107 stop:229 length:123 start_codon:yes stop_codon:yes gene_type:complete
MNKMKDIRTDIQLNHWKIWENIFWKNMVPLLFYDIDIALL